ncbi:Hypothetical predicted protein [Xyrichtys novacula]|uniref:Uncharacterized protein n=1 Tax=Xyrichtys novacula TaxID=13765 RepID=A0AAV1FQK5_XYRNO|nr:Hypothetical predicted protein [Xyrichtys novacula]
MRNLCRNLDQNQNRTVLLLQPAGARGLEEKSQWAAVKIPVVVVVDPVDGKFGSPPPHLHAAAAAAAAAALSGGLKLDNAHKIQMYAHGDVRDTVCGGASVSKLTVHGRTASFPRTRTEQRVFFHMGEESSGILLRSDRGAGRRTDPLLPETGPSLRRDKSPETINQRREDEDARLPACLSPPEQG